MNLIDYPDQDLLMLGLADVIASELASVLDHSPTANLAVPGGTTPGPIFDALCAADLDWERVNVMLSDERWVPENSPRSNTALLRQRLFTNRAAKACLIPLYRAGALDQQALSVLSQRVEEALPLSVVLLGMGEDMHTASLFPGADRLAEALSPNAPVLLPMRANGAGEPRITLTARVINAALSKHLVIKGAAKRTALANALQADDAMDAPVKAILTGTTVHWAQ